MGGQSKIKIYLIYYFVVWQKSTYRKTPSSKSLLGKLPQDNCFQEKSIQETAPKETAPPQKSALPQTTVPTNATHSTVQEYYPTEFPAGELSYQIATCITPVCSSSNFLLQNGVLLVLTYAYFPEQMESRV